jgi:quercetin dioxygenase-like cupin family protein
MEWYTLPSQSVDTFGSHGVRIDPMVVSGGGDDVSVLVAHFEPGGIIGRHRTRIWQLFAVLAGSGWVSGKDVGSEPIAQGEAVLWEPGEEHQSTASQPMVALIILSSSRPPVDSALRALEPTS